MAAALPKYELGPDLGTGSFARVIAGRHRDLQRDVAIKVLSVVHDDAHAGCQAEARLLAKLSHPHIVQVYDYEEPADDLCLIIMELLPGGTLASRMTTLPQEGACAAGLAGAAALACAHSLQVLHRDITPTNLLFNSADVLKATDFGVAKIFEGSGVPASRIVGTRRYMAPEQLRGGQLVPATDLYGLAVIVWELLTGRCESSSSVQERYEWQTTGRPALPSDVPTAVARVVRRALATDPADRHPSAGAFALDLAAAAARSYGPRWIERSGLLLHLDDEVREAAERPMPRGRRRRPPQT